MELGENILVSFWMKCMFNDVLEPPTSAVSTQVPMREYSFRMSVSDRISFNYACKYAVMKNHI